MSTNDPDLDELFRVPPREFIRARNTLATRLRDAGRAKAASDVRSLKRPTIPVWVINQLAHQERVGVERLIQAADRVKAAQLGRGANGDTLKDATEIYRESVRQLLQRAEALLRGAGLKASTSTASRVSTTLVAAAIKPDLRPTLRAGRLTEELVAPGFDVFTGAVTASKVVPLRSRPEEATSRQRQRERRERLLAARTALKLAREEAAARCHDAVELARRADDDRRQAEDAARVAEQAREQAERGAQKLREAEEVVRAAEQELAPGKR